MLNSDEPPNDGAGAPPLVAGAGLDAAKGLLPPIVLPPEVKLKPVEDGGCGLKLAFWLLAPKAGNDELVKVLAGVEDCAGGKLLVAPPPNALLPPKPKPFAPFSLGAGAGLGEPNVPCCGAPKPALCERPCKRLLA